MMSGTGDPLRVMAAACANVDLYNAFGRGKVTEWEFINMVMRGHLGKWLRANYTEDEIQQKVRELLK